jgi:hypothetical protein
MDTAPGGRVCRVVVVGAMVVVVVDAIVLGGIRTPVVEVAPANVVVVDEVVVVVVLIVVVVEVVVLVVVVGRPVIWTTGGTIDTATRAIASRVRRPGAARSAATQEEIAPDDHSDGSAIHRDTGRSERPCRA